MHLRSLARGLRRATGTARLSLVACSEHLRFLAERCGFTAEELPQIRRQRCSALPARR
ncbi:MAG: hypothetical protein IPN34_22865 [Planctomycetes bacterium]|nr:hypothetical protein [Planctomycetota bacterium]